MARKKNKMDLITFSKLYDEFGEEAAKSALDDVNSGRVSQEIIDKYLFDKESKEDYHKRLKEEFKVLEENVEDEEDDDDYQSNYTEDTSASDIGALIGGIVFVGGLIVGGSIQLVKMIKEKKASKEKNEAKPKPKFLFFKNKQKNQS